MKITKIEIKNFRAFYGDHEIDLTEKGQNLLIYGENGSGKSSLLKAIELFLDSHVRDLNFATHRNFFVADTDGGYVKISMGPTENSSETTDERSETTDEQSKTTYEWSETTRETSASVILDASKSKSILDYKALLEVYFLHPKDCEVNLFDFLLNRILGNLINQLTNKPFNEEWSKIQQRQIPGSSNDTKKIQFENVLKQFNDGLAAALNQIQTKVADILSKFGYPIILNFDFQGVTLNLQEKRLSGKEIILKIQFQNTNFPLAHQFLNEAKLSAIALSIYFASLQINPTPTGGLKIMVLDDVLIGLDMSNRLPVIDILKEKFSDYQIFLMTYDKEWYEILKRHFPKEFWKRIELYAGHGTNCEIPILVENKKYLDKAKEYLRKGDHKAAAIYLRTAFEVKIKWFCEKKNIPVKYRQKPKDLGTNDFWNPIKNDTKQNGTPYIEPDLVNKVELYRSFIMNPLSHDQPTNPHQQEIEDAINTVERLEQVLDAIVRSP